MPKVNYGPIELTYDALKPSDFIDSEGFVPLLFIRFSESKNSKKEFWQLLEKEKEDTKNQTELLKLIITKGVKLFNNTPFDADSFFGLCELVMDDGKPFIETNFLLNLFALICELSMPFLFWHVVKNGGPMTINKETAQLLDRQSIRYKRTPCEILAKNDACSELDAYILNTAIMMVASNENSSEMTQLLKKGANLAINYDISRGV